MLNLFFKKGDISIVIQCQQSDKIREVFQKYCTKSGDKLDELVFYYNSKVVKASDKSLFALGISNRSTFDVVDPKYVIGA